MFYVIDYYEDPDGEVVGEFRYYGDAEDFAKQYEEDADYECDLRIE